VSETVGDLIDKLTIANIKIWHAQEQVYEYERMTAEEYAQVPAAVAHKAWKRIASLNLTRTELIGEIDSKLGEAIRNGKAPETPRVKIT